MERLKLVITGSFLLALLPAILNGHEQLQVYRPFHKRGGVRNIFIASWRLPKWQTAPWHWKTAATCSHRLPTSALKIFVSIIAIVNFLKHRMYRRPWIFYVQRMI